MSYGSRKLGYDQGGCVWGVDLRLRRITSSPSQTLRRRLVRTTDDDAAVSARLDACRCSSRLFFHTSRLVRLITLYTCMQRSQIFVQNRVFAYPTCIRRPRYGGFRRNIVILFGTEKLKWLGYPTVKKFRRYIYSL